MSRTPPTIAVVAPGQYITGALWNTQVGGIGGFALTPPIFHGIQTTAQSMPASGTLVPTAFTLNSALLDSEGGWSPTSNPNQYSVKVAGKYMAIANASFFGTVSGDVTPRGAAIIQNGNVMRANVLPALGTFGWIGQTMTILNCAIGDTISAAGLHDYSTALNTVITNLYQQPSLELYWISE